jgi:hypothetical protein
MYRAILSPFLVVVAVAGIIITNIIIHHYHRYHPSKSAHELTVRVVFLLLFLAAAVISGSPDRCERFAKGFEAGIGTYHDFFVLFLIIIV